MILKIDLKVKTNIA